MEALVVMKPLISILLLGLVQGPAEARLMNPEVGGDPVARRSTTEGDRWWKSFLKKEEGGLFLYGPDCEALREREREWSEWSRVSRPAPVLCETTGQCAYPFNCGEAKNPFLKKIGVAGVLPYFIEEYHLRDSPNRHANCWNAVLLFLGEATEEEFVSARTWHDFITDPARCRPLKDDDYLKPGVIGAIRDVKELLYDAEGGGELHGFVLAGEEFAFSKNGPGDEYPYELQPLERIFATFSVSEGCRIPSHPESCGIYVDYFDCSRAR
ncbi:hypothetical protein ACFL2T_04010 [Elusimicrobiota bacterium]